MLAGRARVPAAPVVGAALRVAGGLLALAFVTAVGVWVGAAGEVREGLGFRFTGIPDRLGEALEILVNNARLLTTVLIATLLAQVSVRSGSSVIGRLPVYACDLVLIVMAAAHALLVGAAVGAYGGRMIAALAPHGPAELAGFSLALGLYVTARREPIEARAGAALFAGATAALAVAALLETYASP